MQAKGPRVKRDYPRPTLEKATHLLVVSLHGNPHLFQISGLHISLQFARNPSSELARQCRQPQGQTKGFRERQPGMALRELWAGWGASQTRMETHGRILTPQDPPPPGVVTDSLKLFLPKQEAFWEEAK